MRAQWLIGRFVRVWHSKSDLIKCAGVGRRTLFLTGRVLPTPSIFFRKCVSSAITKRKKPSPFERTWFEKSMVSTSGYYGVISFRSPSALVVGRTRTRLRLNKPSASLAKPLFVVKPNL